MGDRSDIDSELVATPDIWLPWYRAHPREAVVLACGLFAVVTFGHFAVDGNGEAVDILYALPVALLAVTFGLRGGLAGAGIGLALFAVSETMKSTGDIDITGWLTRAAGLLLLGLLLGRATDQIEISRRNSEAAWEERRRIQETARRQSEALEISDSILQHLAAAKWMVEQGRDEEAIDVLSATLETGQRMVADILPPQHVTGTTQSRGAFP